MVGQSPALTSFFKIRNLPHSHRSPPYWLELLLWQAISSPWASNQVLLLTLLTQSA